jgi:hypothetical protein
MQATAAWSAPSMLDEFPTTPPAGGGEGMRLPLPLAGEGWGEGAIDFKIASR